VTNRLTYHTLREVKHCAVWDQSIAEDGVAVTWKERPVAHMSIEEMRVCLGEAIALLVQYHDAVGREDIAKEHHQRDFECKRRKK
jgi:hypothetical protein